MKRALKEMFRPKDTSLKDRCTLRLQALLIVQQLLLFNNPLPSDYDDFGSWIRLEWWEGKAQVELDPTGPGFDGYKGIISIIHIYVLSMKD